MVRFSTGHQIERSGILKIVSYVNQYGWLNYDLQVNTSVSEMQSVHLPQSR